MGDNIRALKPLFVGCFRCVKIGMLKANVFPEPVGAQARISRPWERKGKEKIELDSLQITISNRESKLILFITKVKDNQDLHEA